VAARVRSDADVLPDAEAAIADSATPMERWAVMLTPAKGTGWGATARRGVTGAMDRVKGAAGAGGSKWATKADLGLPTVDQVRPIGAAATDAAELAANVDLPIAAAGGDVLMIGGGGAAAGLEGPDSTTEDTFEKEAEIKIDAATALAAEDVEIDLEAAWRERFHDNYWRKVVTTLAADTEAWHAAAENAYHLRKSIVEACLKQQDDDSMREAVVGVMYCLLFAGSAAAGYQIFYKDGGMEINSVMSFNGGGSFSSLISSSSSSILPSRLQDVFAAARAGGGVGPKSSSSSSVVREAGSIMATKNLSKLSTEELKAQPERLRSRKE